MRTETVYVCDGCQARYGTKEEAAACEARSTPPPLAAYGDIVFAGAGFGWFDGDQRWVENFATVGQGYRPGMRLVDLPRRHRNCFRACCTFRFYYVVGHVDQVDHRNRYHLFTGAMSGVSGYDQGYTFDSNHVTPVRVAEPPKAVVADSCRFLGRVSNRLL